MAEYKQTVSVKILRKKHAVTCFPQDHVSNIVEMLLKVPVGSVADDFCIDDNGVLTMVFYDERVVSND